MRYAKIVDGKLVFTDAKKPVLVDGNYQLVDKTAEDLQGYKEYVEITDEVGENQYLMTELYETDTQVVKHKRAVDYTEEELAAIKEAEELSRREYIDNLPATQREIIYALEKGGISYTEMLLPLLNSDPLVSASFWGAKELIRKDPMITQFGQELGLSIEQIDEVFLAIAEARANE